MTRKLCQHSSRRKSSNRNRGYYILIMRLSRRCRMPIGALGTHDFPAGWYAYVGRAKRNLPERIERHYRRRKPLRWHIDWFLRHARIQRTILVRLGRRSECSLARGLTSREGACTVVARFGASDCRCPGHLIYLGPTRPPDGNELLFEGTLRPGLLHSHPPNRRSSRSSHSPSADSPRSR